MTDTIEKPEEMTAITKEIDTIAMIVLMHQDAFGKQTQQDALHIIALRYSPEERRTINASQLTNIACAGSRIAHAVKKADSRQPGALLFDPDDKVTPIVCDLMAAIIAGEEGAVETAKNTLAKCAQQLDGFEASFYTTKANELRMYQQALSFKAVANQALAS
tara:strand:+ start:7275 stop:7760 length:486 start_codon:yes stop_codon:yes gene_type:complete